MLTSAALSSAIALLAFASITDAHGHLKSPEPTFEAGKPTVEWVTLIDNYWDIGSGGDQVGKFKTMAAEKGLSVKDVVLDMVKDKTCGYTRTDVDPKPVPTDGKAIWWGNGGGGFTHTGPCEIYIDDKMVLHGDDCEDEYPGGPLGSEKMSEMPIDYSSCNGDCVLTIYWLAFQNAQWQAYINCVPLTGSGGSTTQTQAQSTAGSSTEIQSTGAPSPEMQTTDAPAPEAQATEDPSTGTAATPAPASETQSTEASSTGAEPTPAPVATTQVTQAPSVETETQAPPIETDTKCTPARRLRKKTSTL